MKNHKGYGRLAAMTATCALSAGLIAGCSGGPALPSLSTGSILGGGGETAKKDDTSHLTPTARALQVGTTAARALKCGYNFDPATLKANYLSAEASAGISVDELGQLEKIYDTGFNGVTKAVTDPESYCTSQKTEMISADLNRHLAGDYSAKKKKVAKAEGGLFSGWGDAVPDKGPKFGTDSWWDKQRDAAGK